MADLSHMSSSIRTPTAKCGNVGWLAIVLEVLEEGIQSQGLITLRKETQKLTTIRRTQQHTHHQILLVLFPFYDRENNCDSFPG